MLPMLGTPGLCWGAAAQQSRCLKTTNRRRPQRGTASQLPAALSARCAVAAPSHVRVCVWCNNHSGWRPELYPPCNAALSHRFRSLFAASPQPESSKRACAIFSKLMAISLSWFPAQPISTDSCRATALLRDAKSVVVLTVDSDARAPRPTLPVCMDNPLSNHRQVASMFS